MCKKVYICFEHDILMFQQFSIFCIWLLVPPVLKRSGNLTCLIDMLRVVDVFSLYSILFALGRAQE